MDIITSTTNPTIKAIKSLKDKKTRYVSGLFVVEGSNIVKDLPSSVEVKYLVVDESKREQFASLIDKYVGQAILVSSKVMATLSETVTPCGILAVVKVPTARPIGGGNIVVMDGVADPGNMGTIIRSSVACGIADVIAVDCTDHLSGKVVRSSMGGVLKCNIVPCDREEVAELLQGKQVLVLDMNGKSIFDLQVDDSKPWALVVGNEAHGISETLRNRADQIVSLPMKGDMESLNAGVSLSVGLFELVFNR
ncbi:MAG: TrmH family RNA methyltransferase [Christensenellales bacterium]